jgi:hypothetical protein
MCILVVLEISHAGAQLASLGIMNLKFNVVCQTVFAILMLRKLLSGVSRVFSDTWISGHGLLVSFVSTHWQRSLAGRFPLANTRSLGPRALP